MRFLVRRFSWDSFILAGLLAIGLGLRLLNLTEPPLDFHPTRQLRAAIIARGMYYQSLPGADPRLRDAAVNIWATMESYEPPILERLVALTYRMTGGEHLWMARIYSSLFWVAGGAALYALIRRVFAPGGRFAALFGLAFYLILPWGVLATRTFQPDPWMVMWILFAAYALYRWAESRALCWRWTLLAGLFSGLAILIKVYAVFPVAGMAFGLLAGDLLLSEKEAPLLTRLRALARRPQIWAAALLAAAIPAVYYLSLGERSSSFASFWIFSFTDLLLDRKFYIQWLGLIRGLMDVMIFFAALLGVFLFPPRGRALLAGLWAGYFLIGATFPYQIYTHDYYSLVLVPIAAISLAVYADWMGSRVRRQPFFWKAVFAAVFLCIAGYYAWAARSQVIVVNNRAEPEAWQRMGAELPQQGSIIAITHDYGNRLKYYGWRTVNKLWPTLADQQLTAAANAGSPADRQNFEEYFLQETAGMDFFLVTLFADLEAQPELKNMLYNHYPLYQQGDGYVLFDLRRPAP